MQVQNLTFFSMYGTMEEDNWSGLWPSLFVLIKDTVYKWYKVPDSTC